MTGNELYVPTTTTLTYRHTVQYHTNTTNTCKQV